MSLQVWLPFTKDLRNQGLGSVQTTNNTIFILKSGGKLGASCLDLSNTVRLYSPNLVNLKAFSFAFWYRPETSESTINWNDVIGFNDSKGGLFRLETSYSNSYMLSMHNNTQYGIIQNVAASYGNTLLLSSASYSRDVWYHIAVTVEEDNNVKAYVNGELKCVVARSDGSITGYFNLGELGGSDKEDGSLNDLRIYDHCLSELEVKQLSQGLVLHYLLDSNSTYTSLVDKTAPYTIYNNHGVTASLIRQSGFFRGSPVYRLSMTPTSSTLYSFRNGLHSHGVYGWRQTFAASTKYVFWIYYKPVTHMDVRVGGTASNISGWTEIPPEYVGDGWYRVGQYRNGTVTEAKTDNIFTSFYTPTAEADVPIQIDFACPMLVQGLTEIQDSISYSVGNIVYDNSGYCNNGTMVGTLSNTSDTPKYRASTYFASGNNYIDCGASQEVLPTDGLTVSLWVNYSAWGNPISCTEGGGWNFENSSGIQFPVYITGVGYKVANSGIATSTLVGGWHMLTGTFDKTNVKIYVDGILKATTATGSTNGIGYAANHCYVGAEAAGSTSIASAALVGKISDVRIYATALSATDVKSLYQNCATIDADGTIHGQIRS